MTMVSVTAITITKEKDSLVKKKNMLMIGNK
jgi:hypothetical protein